MNHRDERWTIECMGCLSSTTVTRRRSETMDMHRERAAAVLMRHRDHLDQVAVTAPAWRQLDMFGIGTVPA